LKGGDDVLAFLNGRPVPKVTLFYCLL